MLSSLGNKSVIAVE